MFVIKCLKCEEVLGGVINPGSIPFIRCMKCGFDNPTNICITKDDYYEDCREKGITEEELKKSDEFKAVLKEYKMIV